VRAVILLALATGCYGPSHPDDVQGDGPQGDGLQADGPPTGGDGPGCGPEFCGDGIDGDCQGDPDPTCPSNDGPETPIDVSAGGLFNGDVRFAHDDAAPGCTPPGGRDLFFQLTLPRQEVVYLDTIAYPVATFDTALSIRQGTCTSLGSELACNDDSCSGLQSQLAVELAGGTYCVIVDQASPGQYYGGFVLHVVLGGRTGTHIVPGAVGVNGDTCGALDDSAPETNCGALGGLDAAYWFTLCDGHTYSITADTCTSEFDSLVYLRKGSSSNPSLACDGEGCSPNGMIAAVIPPDEVPGLFWLIVDGASLSSCGTYHLSANIE